MVGREGGRERGREGGREGRREGGRERGREEREGGHTVGIKKKFPSPVRTTGRVIPFRSRLISV